jgi:DNA-directed RNA polymerase specialized sigma24 family protein
MSNTERVGNTHHELLGATTLESWIVQNTQAATDHLPRILRSPRQVAIFKAFITGLSPDEISQEFQIKEGRVKKQLNNVLRRLTKSTGLPPEESPSLIIKGLQARLLIERCQQGDKQAAQRLIHLWPGTFASLQRQVPEPKRDEYAQSVLQKIIRSVPPLKWPGTKKFIGWLYTIEKNTAIDFQRRRTFAEKRAQQKEKRRFQDPLSTLLDEHPRKGNQLIALLPHNQQLIFRAVRQGLLLSQILAAHFPDKSPSYVRVQLNLACNFLDKRAGIAPIPPGYQTLSRVARQLTISPSTLRRDIGWGQIAGVEFRRGIFYLDPQETAAFYNRPIPPQKSMGSTISQMQESEDSHIKVEKYMATSFLKGDASAIDWFIDQFQDKLYRFFLTQTGSVQQAHNLTTETYDLLPKIVGKFLQEDEGVSLLVRVFREAIDLSVKEISPCQAGTLPDDLGRLTSDQKSTIVLYQLAPDSHSQSARTFIALRFAAGLSDEKVALVLQIPLDELKQKQAATLRELTSRIHK